MPRTINPFSRSMHEMYEIPDLNAYADAMEDMNGKTVTPPPEEAEDDGFMFIDESSSPRSVGAAKSTRPIQVTTGCSSMMRRSMSMARLPSEVERQKKSFSLLTMLPDMHSSAIEEEEEEENAGDDDSVASNDVCLDKSLYKGQQLEVRPTNDLTNSANRRPSRRVSQGGPLKSSLKSSLRTSQTSIASDLSEDSSQHSMKRNVSFSNLEIRSYGVTLGDCPTLSGPPISLDYKDDPQTQVHDVEIYEQLRSVTPENPTPLNPRRKGDELFIHPSHRQYLLMRDAGFSRMQIKQAKEEAQRAAIERKKGAKRSVRLDEMLEKANSRFRVWQKKSTS